MLQDALGASTNWIDGTLKLTYFNLAAAVTPGATSLAQLPSGESIRRLGCRVSIVLAFLVGRQ